MEIALISTALWPTNLASERLAPEPSLLSKFHAANAICQRSSLIGCEEIACRHGALLNQGSVGKDSTVLMFGCIGCQIVGCQNASRRDRHGMQHLPLIRLVYFWNVKDSSQVALAFVQGLASSLDPGSVCVCCFSASVSNEVHRTA